MTRNEINNLMKNIYKKVTTEKLVRRNTDISELTAWMARKGAVLPFRMEICLRREREKKY